MPPRSALYDVAHRNSVDVKHCGKSAVAEFCLSVHLAQLYDERISHLCHPARLPFMALSEDMDAVRRVLFRGDPFQIVGAVVGLNPVLVVDG